MRLREIYRLFWQNFRGNRIVQVFTISDLLILSGLELVSPIFAVFVTGQIIGGDIFVAGLASSIYAFFNGFAAIPVASFIDYRKGEKDDFWILLLGSVIMTLGMFSYLVIKFPWQLYLVGAISGVGSALATTAWYAIFSRHLDKDSVALEWSFYSTITSLGGAAAAAIGGAVAEIFGFQSLFLGAGTVVLLGTILLLFVSRRFDKR